MYILFFLFPVLFSFYVMASIACLLNRIRSISNMICDQCGTYRQVARCVSCERSFSLCCTMAVGSVVCPRCRDPASVIFPVHLC